MVDVEVLRLALKKESEAVEFYQEMLKTNPAVKDILYVLISEEQRHKKMIEKKIIELTKY